MKLKIEIDCDNAAFDDEPATELSRILRVLAGRIEEGYLPEFNGWQILDVNGNTVGHWSAD